PGSARRRRRARPRGQLLRVRRARARTRAPLRAQDRGMLHAIERLTNLYDLSKAFGSTIDMEELSEIIVKKATDFANAEMGSLWMLEGEGEVGLAATAANEN